MNGAEVLDLVLEFAAPINEGGFGDVEFLGDAGEAPALTTELHEAFLGDFILHGRNYASEERTK